MRAAPSEISLGVLNIITSIMAPKLSYASVAKLQRQVPFDADPKSEVDKSERRSVPTSTGIVYLDYPIDELMKEDPR